MRSAARPGGGRYAIGLPARRHPLTRALAAVCLILLLAFGSVASAAQPLVTEQTFLAVTIKGAPYKLEALVVKEAGASGRLPVAIVTHGQAAEPQKRELLTPESHLRLAREFARRGWLGVVVVRRGFGRSDGEKPYALRGCRDGDYGTLLDDQADDLEAAIEAVSRRADADPATIVALGISVGGATVLSLAARHPRGATQGLKAVVNISGGVRTRQREGAPAVTCTAEDLVPLFAALGKRTRLPTLWLYAENDSFFPADYVRRLHETYVANGGRTQFHMFEPIGNDGHHMAFQHEGMLRWIPALDRFLRAHQLKGYDPAPIDAAIGTLGLTAPARQVVYRYHGRPTEKALAVSQSKRAARAQFGGTDLAAMEAKALGECQKQANEPCRILLRNFEVVGEAR